MGFVDLCVQGRAIRGLETVIGGGRELIPLRDQRCVAFQQNRVKFRARLGGPVQIFAERQGAQTELLAVVGIDGQRHL